MKLYYENKTTIEEIDHRFGEYDSKGREKGRHIKIYTARVIESTNRYYSKLTDLGLKQNDIVYIVNAQSSRDGKRFGACQTDKFFKTIDDCTFFAHSKRI